MILLVKQFLLAPILKVLQAIVLLAKRYQYYQRTAISRKPE
jgi:hypothetical protein